MVHSHQMQLEYLLFDFNDDESGSCSFDSLALVLPIRLPALIHEVETVLTWAHRHFGALLNAGDEGEWNFELQAADEHDVPLEINYDVERARVALPSACGRVTLALTISGSAAFGAAFRDAFPEAE